MKKSSSKADETDEESEDVTIEQRLKRIEELLGHHLDLQITSLWMSQYSRLDNAVTRDAVNSMKAMIHEFVTREHSAKMLNEKGADGFDKWIEQLLVTQRVYEYLLFVNGFTRSFPGPKRFPDGEFATRRWLRELCWNREFQMVHVRQGGYYPDFTRLVNGNLRREARRAESLQEPESASQMRECASLAAGSLAYAEFIEYEENDIKRYSQILGIAESRGYFPLNHENFLRLWVDFLEKHEEGEIPGDNDDVAN